MRKYLNCRYKLTRITRVNIVGMRKQLSNSKHVNQIDIYEEEKKKANSLILTFIMMCNYLFEQHKYNS
jgi:hypothetical protein